jgi:hypothetical protein
METKKVIQEIKLQHNTVKPVSEKRKRYLERRAEGSSDAVDVEPEVEKTEKHKKERSMEFPVDHIAFGEVADRPPSLNVKPRLPKVGLKRISICLEIMELILFHTSSFFFFVESQNATRFIESPLWYCGVVIRE